MSAESTLTVNEQHLAEEIAHCYLQETKKWQKNDYHLESLRTGTDPRAPMIILDAAHSDDLNSRGRGPSQSAQLHIDMNHKRVAKELAYQ